MLGYLGQPDATAEALRGGVLHTGDLGFLDEHGQLVIRGRRTEMILRGGANVYPAEVERVVLDHPGVREVAVLGLVDDRLGEVVVAGLVAEPGPWADGDPDLLVDDVRSFCRERLARYKVPDRMLVLDRFPRNTMGKVIKGDLAPAFE
jgi:long-chain acyl-CoA synthetase